MSLSISLYRDNKEIMAMNWLRNPFGLERWASDNVPLQLKKDLWYVCNHWNYEKSNRINRQLFLDVVMQYWAGIKKLKEGYFFFSLPSYRQFVEGKTQYLDTMIGWAFGGKRIKGEKYVENRLAIPMWQFNEQVVDLGGQYQLDDYKNWFKELVGFAKLLQDKRNRFYCSN